VGATLVRVGERADSDFVGLGLTRNPAYTRLDARLRVRLGYPSLGRSLRGGLRLRVGGATR